MIQLVRPNTLGWIQKKLSDEEMQHLWKCIEVGGADFTLHLAGQNLSSNSIHDLDNIFWDKTLLPLCSVYAETFQNLGSNMPKWIPYYLGSMWVNYQKQTQFNPTHAHDGIYSFVIWMKIPTVWEDQNTCQSTKSCVSSFEFLYSDILGKHHTYQYDLGPEDEGTLLFFPAQLWHQVYPFFNSDETRISISGNINYNY